MELCQALNLIELVDKLEALEEQLQTLAGRLAPRQLPIDHENLLRRELHGCDQECENIQANFLALLSLQIAAQGPTIGEEENEREE